ncbi:hypothetical protein HDU85_001959 [Gaertneriomyces sp. JEL0708]|nr:hypothetical protein HDU85_001959 [Gaertneriomyces sp. JEL0708]
MGVAPAKRGRANRNDITLQLLIMDESHNPFYPYSDWRVSLLGVEKQAIHIVYVLGVILNGGVAVANLILLYYFVVIKRQKIVSFANGIVRPQPVPAYLTSSAIFAVGRTIFSIMMISGAYGYGKANNEGYIMEAFHEWPWGFGYSAIALYLMGIIFATPATVNDPTLSAVYLPSPVQMNIFAGAMIALPVVLANTFAGISGYFYDHKNMTLALRFTSLHYWVWGTWSFLLMLSGIFFGRQLDRLIGATVKQLAQTKGLSNFRHLEATRVRLSRMTLILTLILFAYTVAIIAYATGQRVIITKYRAVSFLFCTLWNFSAPGFMSIVALVLAIGVYQELAAKYAKSADGNSTVYQRCKELFAQHATVPEPSHGTKGGNSTVNEAKPMTIDT